LAESVELIRKQSASGGLVLAVNEVARYLRGREIEVWAAAHLGPVSQTVACIGEPLPGVRYYLASICPPEAFDAVANLDVWVWHPDMPEVRHELDRLGVVPTPMIGGGATISLRCLELGYLLGFRRFLVHGLDSSVAGRMHAYPSVSDGEERDLIDVECDGRWYRTSPEMAGQALGFVAAAEKLLERGASLTIFGKGIVPDAWRAREKLGIAPPIRRSGPSGAAIGPIAAMTC
jgi:hypothetical protein